MSRKPTSLADLSNALRTPASQPQSEAEASGAPERKTPSGRKYARPTPRNEQLNIRVTPDTRRRFEALAERTGAPLAIAFEWAVEALEQEIDSEKDSD